MCSACWLCLPILIILHNLKFCNNLIILFSFCQIAATAMPEDYRYKKVLTFHPFSRLIVCATYPCCPLFYGCKKCSSRDLSASLDRL